MADIKLFWQSEKALNYIKKKVKKLKTSIDFELAAISDLFRCYHQLSPWDSPLPRFWYSVQKWWRSIELIDDFWLICWNFLEPKDWWANYSDAVSSEAEEEINRQICQPVSQDLHDFTSFCILWEIFGEEGRLHNDNDDEDGLFGTNAQSLEECEPCPVSLPNRDSMIP